ncbi:hypothetical protein [Hydrogenophaga sp.]|uniref:hypothetical protein n=1 Tax=Hydrogenophaga sp. TaxID=1904254 RepID=UPI003D140FD7
MPIERPELKVGDTWITRALDGWNNRETGQFTLTVSGFENGRTLVRTHALPADQTYTRMFTPDWHICRSMRNSTEAVCGGPLLFPLTDSYRHSYRRLPNNSGVSYYDGDCEGRGFEKVRVPAGEFDAFKVECTGTWTRVFGGSSTGRYDETFWYAPSVRNHVKQVFNSRLTSGSPDIRLIVELIEFKPAP